jgi:hypothetical protein
MEKLLCRKSYHAAFVVAASALVRLLDNMNVSVRCKNTGKSIEDRGAVARNTAKIRTTDASSYPRLRAGE